MWYSGHLMKIEPQGGPRASNFEHTSPPPRAHCPPHVRKYAPSRILGSPRAAAAPRQLRDEHRRAMTVLKGQSGDPIKDSAGTEIKVNQIVTDAACTRGNELFACLPGPFTLTSVVSVATVTASGCGCIE